MNDLWEILDTATSRKLLLLEQIKDAQSFVTFQALAEMNQWERRTVLRYIESLADDAAAFAQPDLFLVIEENRVRIDYKDYKSFQSFYLFTLETSLPIRVLESLLLGDTVSLTDCLDKYFISESTFKRRLKPLKAFLATYDLNFVRHDGTFTLEGLEHRIRMFAYNFFWKLYRGRKWPFPTISEKKTIDIIDYLLKDYSDLWNETNDHQIRFVLAINLSRYYKGLKIKFTKEQLHTYFSQEYLDEPRPWLNVFQLPEEEIHFFFLLAQTKERFLSIPIFKEPVIGFHRETNSEIYQATERFFTYFSQMIFPLSEKDKQEYYVHLFANHFFCALFNHFPVGMGGFSNKETIEEQLPVLTKKIDTLIKKLQEDTQFPLFQNRDFLFPRYALFFSLLTDITFFEDLITVYIDVDYPELLEDRLMEDIHIYFHREFNLKIFRSADGFPEHPIDLILTTSFIPKKNIHGNHTLYLLDSLRPEDIFRIWGVFTEIRRKREEIKASMQTTD